jgi:hypothetical protein
VNEVQRVVAGRSAPDGLTAVSSRRADCTKYQFAERATRVICNDPGDDTTTFADTRNALLTTEFIGRNPRKVRDKINCCAIGFSYCAATVRSARAQ